MSAHRISATLLFLACSLMSVAQSLYRIPMDEKIRESSLILEGRVTASRTFWNDAHTMIYTANRVDITKLFKGEPAAGVVEVLTAGGVVNDTFMIASDLLQLRPGETGIFFCEPAPPSSTARGAALYNIYASSQGVLKYDLGARTASAPFARYQDIARDLYPVLTSAAGRSYRDLNPGFDVAAPSRPVTARGEAPAISGFSPASVTAGKRSDPATNQLVINGSGFGTATGLAAVIFDDADDGPGGSTLEIPAGDESVISWTNTQIVIRVPSYAGTGALIVRDAGGVTASAATQLEVLYAIINFFGGSSPFDRMLALVNNNGLGGDNYRYSTSTANGAHNFNTSAEAAPFGRAVNTWKQMVGLNFSYAGTTGTQSVNVTDGENVIMFDNTATGNAPLPAGVLAVCYSGGTTCDQPYAYRTDFDIVVRNTGISLGSTNFNNGPCATRTDISEIDMESVMLHELGHALNLAHINDSYKGSSLPQIDPQRVMNYAIVNGVDRRSPDWAALEGARFCVNPKAVGSECGYTEMVPLATTIEPRDECPTSFPTTPTPLNSNISFDLAHASSNRFADPQYTRVNTSGTGTGITNTAWYAIRTNANGGTLNLAVTGYVTDPASQAACASDGVELSLYNVNSCPAGQAFPAPVAYRTFSGNGSLTSITGLAANSNYLMMLDGISNTKASFSLSLVGTALPVRLLRFRARRNNRQSDLSWTAADEQGVQVYIAEVSRNDGDWQYLGQVPATGTAGDHDYAMADVGPEAGINRYRLRIRDIDGRETFSETEVVEFAGPVPLQVFPNPAENGIQLRITGNVSLLQVRLFGTDGRLLWEKRIVRPGSQVTIPAAGLSAGLYHLEAYLDGQRVLTRVMKK